MVPSESACHCDCTKTIYKIRDIKLSEEEYNRVIDVLGEIDSDKLRAKRKSLDRQIKEAETNLVSAKNLRRGRKYVSK